MSWVIQRIPDGLPIPNLDAGSWPASCDLGECSRPAAGLVWRDRSHKKKRPGMWVAACEPCGRSREADGAPWLLFA